MGVAGGEVGRTGCGVDLRGSRLKPLLRGCDLGSRAFGCTAFKSELHFVLRFVLQSDGPMPNISIRIPDDLDQRLSEAAEKEARPRSDVARDAIHWYLETMEKKRFMQALLEDAQRLTAQETVAIAEDYVLLDNEALNIGEPRGRYKTKKKKS